MTHPHYIAAICALFFAILFLWRTAAPRDGGPTLIAFITPHCPHCKACKGEIEEYSSKRDCRVVDVSDPSDDIGASLATKLGVRGVPSFFFQTGETVFHAVPADAPRTAATWAALAQKL